MLGLSRSHYFIGINLRADPEESESTYGINHLKIGEAKHYLDES